MNWWMGLFHPYNCGVVGPNKWGYAPLLITGRGPPCMNQPTIMWFDVVLFSPFFLSCPSIPPHPGFPQYGRLFKTLISEGGLHVWLGGPGLFPAMIGSHIFGCHIAVGLGHWMLSRCCDHFGTSTTLQARKHGCPTMSGEWRWWVASVTWIQQNVSWRLLVRR